MSGIGIIHSIRTLFGSPRREDDSDGDLNGNVDGDDDDDRRRRTKEDEGAAAAAAENNDGSNEKGNDGGDVEEDGTGNLHEDRKKNNAKGEYGDGDGDERGNGGNEEEEEDGCNENTAAPGESLSSSIGNDTAAGQQSLQTQATAAESSAEPATMPAADDGNGNNDGNKNGEEREDTTENVQIQNPTAATRANNSNDSLYQNVRNGTISTLDISYNPYDFFDHLSYIHDRGNERFAKSMSAIDNFFAPHVVINDGNDDKSGGFRGGGLGNNGNDLEGHSSHVTLATVANHRNGQSDNGSMSYGEWRKERKHLLREYLTRRLFGCDEEEDGEAEEEQGKDEDDKHTSASHDDDFSFSSSVLDEPFDSEDEVDHPSEAQEDAAIHLPDKDANDQHNGSEEEDGESDATVPYESQPLETQPQTGQQPTTPATNATTQSASADDLEQSMDTDQLETQEEEGAAPPGSGADGGFGSVKRKLGFENQQDYDKNAMQQPSKKRPRTQHEPSSSSGSRQRKRRGRAWDGRYRSVVHVDATSSSGPCTQLAELDLNSATLNLSLCRVQRIWGMRRTRRAEKQDGDAALDFCENDGPLNTIYDRVVSMEIAQLSDNDDDEGNDTNLRETDPSLARMADAAFSDGRRHLAKTNARKRRHAVRRIRIFFYNQYADAIAEACGNLGKRRHKIPSFLLSLTSVPAKCIFPCSVLDRGRFRDGGGSGRYDAHLQQYAQHPFGDEDFGVLSSYCICIGDKSNLKDLGEDGRRRKPIHFDSTDVEIHLVETPATTEQPLLEDDNKNSEDENNHDLNEDAVITRESLNGGESGPYYMGGEASDLIKRYDAVINRKSNTVVVEEEEEEPILFHPDDDDEDIANNTSENNDADPSRSKSSDRTKEDNPDRGNTANPPGAPEAGETTAQSARIARPRSVIPLSDLSQILIRNNMKSPKDPITVYGIVLGFRPPSLTKTEQWVMSIVLVDDTLPLSHSVQGQTNALASTAESSVDHVTNNTNGNPKEMHVPSVTLVLFAKDKSKLPVVKMAGDVVCCEKVILQHWSGEPQLCARKMSRIIVVRPSRLRCPGDGLELHDSTSPSDYLTSCLRHGSNNESTTLTNLHWSWVNFLWQWGQRRLSAHPTMSPHCYISISELGNDDNTNKNQNNFEVSASGDLTAAVTGIIPVPEHLRRRDTPRGYVRLWDGTGPSKTDSLPLNLGEGNANQQLQDDPPERVLTTIEKILLDRRSSSPPSSWPKSSVMADDNVTIRAPIALCGRVINAIIWEENLWDLIHRENMIEVGSFVRLRNINNAKLPITGTHCLSVHAKSSLTPLPFDAHEIKVLLKGHNTRVSSGVPTNPTSAILPAAASSRQRAVGNQETKRHGFSTVRECLEKPAPASFTTHFEVSHTLPICNPTSIDAMKALYTKRKNGSFSFRFALHIKDSTSEVDVLCLGRVAEDLLGITTQDIIAENPEKCKAALDTLKELLSPGSICEGKIQSTLGKDGKLYFILKSIFCIPTDIV